MPSRPTFTGLRLQFLEGELEKYNAAVANGTQEDYAMDIVRRYFKRFPPDLCHDTEPSLEHLASVDDSLPDIELVKPCPLDYPEDEPGFNALEKAWFKRKPEIDLRREQILCWLKYHQPSKSAETAEDFRDLLAIMKYRLLGKEFKKPRRRIAYHVWLKDPANKALVDAAYAKARPIGGKFDLRVHTTVGTKIYNEQPQDIRVMTKKLAVKNHEDALREWRRVLKFDTSTDLKARQDAVIQPIFDLIVELTGMRVTFMMGGPEPADQGRLNIIGLHAGHTKGAVRMNFGQAEAQAYERQVVPVFSAFLRKCYTREDCQATSLNDGSTSIFSIVGLKDVTYGPAAGENYGPPVDKSSESSNVTKPLDATKSKKTDAKSKKTDEQLKKTNSKSKRPDVNPRETGLEPEVQNEVLSNEGSPTDRRLAMSSPWQHDSPPATPIASQRDSRASTLSSSFESVRRVLCPHNSSPDPDHLPVSPPSSHPPSPISLTRAPTLIQDYTVASNLGSASASATPPRRCGPPGRRPGDANKAWRLKRSASSASGQPVSRPFVSSEGLSTPLPRLPTPAARTLVPAIHGEHPEFSTKFLDPLPEAAAITRNIAQRMFSRANTSTSAHGTAPSASSGGKRRRFLSAGAAEADEVVERSKRQRVDSRPDKENPQSNGIQNFDTDQVLEQARKWKSGDVPEEAASKRCKTSGRLHSSTKHRKSAPRMSTRSRPPRTTRAEDVTPPLSPSSTLTSSFAQWVLPTEASDAIKQTLQLVRLGCWGSDWAKLITTWLAFEVPRGYPADQRLPSKHRPPAVAEWIQRARAPSYRPKFKAKEYNTTFWKWWAALQPEWREIEAGTTLREVDGEWDALNKAGTNGLASVMAALCFWRFAVEEEGEEDSSWTLAVKDKLAPAPPLPPLPSRLSLLSGVVLYTPRCRLSLSHRLVIISRHPFLSSSSLFVIIFASHHSRRPRHFSSGPSIFSNLIDSWFLPIFAIYGPIYHVASTFITFSQAPNAPAAAAPASSNANNSANANAPSGNVAAASNPNIVTSGLPDLSRFDRSFYPRDQRWFYLVCIGNALGMHPDWPSALAATSGYSGATWQRVEWDRGMDILRNNLTNGNVHYAQLSSSAIARTRAQQRAGSAPPAFNTGNPAPPSTAVPQPSTVQPVAAPLAFNGTPTRSTTTAPPMLTIQPTPSPGNNLSRQQTPRRLFQQRTTRVLSPIPDVVPETPLGSPAAAEAPAAAVPQESPGHQSNPIYYSPSPTPVPTPGRASNPIVLGSTPARPASASQSAPASNPAPAPTTALQPAANAGRVYDFDPTRPRPPLRFVDQPLVPSRLDPERQRHFTRPGFVPNRGGASRQPQYRIHPFTGRPVRVPDEFDDGGELTDSGSDTDGEDGVADEGNGVETRNGIDGKGGEDSEKEDEVDARPHARHAVQAHSCYRCGSNIDAAPRPAYSSVGTQTKTVFLLSALSSPEQGLNEADTVTTDEEDYVTATDSTPSSGSSGSRSLKRKSPDADEEEYLSASPPRHVSGRRPFVRLFDSPEDGPPRLPSYPQGRAGAPGLFEPRLLNLQPPATPASPASSVRSDMAVYGTSPARSSPPQLDSDTEYGHLTDYSDPTLYSQICQACDDAQERYKKAKRRRHRH